MQEFLDMGFNGLSGGQGLSVTRPEEGKEGQPTGLINEAKMAEKYNLAYDVLLSPHDIPGWMHAKYPDLDPSHRRRGAAPDQPLSPKNQYMPWNVDCEGLRKALADHVRICANALKASPAFTSWDLCNEMWYLCHGDFKADDFRARLKDRYKDIAALNTAWGTSFADFKDVQFQANSKVATADLYEYNQNRATEFFRWYTKELQKYDTNHVIYGKIHGCWRQMIGIDKGELTKFFTATDSDVYPRLGNDEENLIADMWTAAIVTQEYRSLAPEKPQIDSEQHMIWYHQIVTDDFIYSLLWWRGVLGLDANYVWIWNRGCENYEECIFTQPWAMHSTSRFALDVERLAPMVHQFQQIKPDVMMVECSDYTPKAHKFLSFSGYAFDVLPVNVLTPERLSAYKTIVIPENPQLNEATANAIKGSKARVIWMNEKMSFKDLVKKVSTDQKPIAKFQYGLVNYMARDKSGKPMAFLLNLNVEPVEVKLSLPHNGKAINPITGREITGDKFQLNPLDPIIVAVQ